MLNQHFMADIAEWTKNFHYSFPQVQAVGTHKEPLLNNGINSGMFLDNNWNSFAQANKIYEYIYLYRFDFAFV